MNHTDQIDKLNLVWIDMEMSGLDFEQDVILEVATIITDKDLNILAEGPELVLRQNEELFAKMDDWNQKHHTQSGLWEKVLKSDVSLESAEEQTLDFIKKYTKPSMNILCGNSIAQDRLFILKHMPELNKHLHYRMIDVTSIKELGKRWYGSKFTTPEKLNKHRALDDIKESIEELKHYQKFFFKDKITE